MDPVSIIVGIFSLFVGKKPSSPTPTPTPQGTAQSDRSDAAVALMKAGSSNGLSATFASTTPNSTGSQNSTGGVVSNGGGVSFAKVGSTTGTRS
jgi:hypothetical protein